MPIRDYRCPECGFELINLIEPISQLPIHVCHDCGTDMCQKIGQIAPIPPTGDTLKYIQKKERFKKRNARIEQMTPKQQDGFKKLIDSTGGKRYL